jgi:metallo-beta-lactamase family protein
MSQSGNILIPAFAVERTQEILYELGELSRSGHQHNIPVFLDSPLAIRANVIFRNNTDYFDKETQVLLKNNQSPLDMPDVHATTTPDESKHINNFKRSLIIAGSGMCNAGRIKHHLKHHLWKKETHVIFVGYQASGTLGRRIVDGEKMVKIFGEDIVVRAHIHTLGGFSAHADQAELMYWLGTSTSKPKHIFLVHGEDNDRAVLQERLTKDGYTSSLPTLNEVTSL